MAAVWIALLRPMVPTAVGAVSLDSSAAGLYGCCAVGHGVAGFDGKPRVGVSWCRLVSLLLPAHPHRRRESKAATAFLVSNIVERTCINTFHGFCMQVLHWHGAHFGVKSDFIVTPETVCVVSCGLLECGEGSFEKLVE
ncbi:MAG: hypothetical protein OXI96_03135 [Acidimicrobiaceae bacterium]|nr:hypothetical protein [Acidimicrobiaceae bacterium]